jgi:hypothetical protein
MDMEWSERASPVELLRGDDLRTPDEVAAMLRLRSLGLGMKRIAAELGCSRNTVRRSIEAQGWVGWCRRRRDRALAGLEEWVAERFWQHRGNAENRIARDRLNPFRNHPPGRAPVTRRIPQGEQLPNAIRC